MQQHNERKFSSLPRKKVHFAKKLVKDSPFSKHQPRSSFMVGNISVPLVASHHFNKISFGRLCFGNSLDLVSKDVPIADVSERLQKDLFSPSTVRHTFLQVLRSRLDPLIAARVFRSFRIQKLLLGLRNRARDAWLLGTRP